MDWFQNDRNIRNERVNNTGISVNKNEYLNFDVTMGSFDDAKWTS